MKKIKRKTKFPTYIVPTLTCFFYVTGTTNTVLFGLRDIILKLITVEYLNVNKKGKQLLLQGVLISNNFHTWAISLHFVVSQRLVLLNICTDFVNAPEIKHNNTKKDGIKIYNLNAYVIYDEDELYNKLSNWLSSLKKWWFLYTQSINTVTSIKYSGVLNQNVSRTED